MGVSRELQVKETETVAIHFRTMFQQQGKKAVSRPGK